jgi:uncharacterized protein YwqG
MKTLDDILRPLVRQASVLEVRTASSDLPAVSSKFGGIPYHEAGEAWPECPTCERPLSFVCQLDLRTTNYPERNLMPFFTFFYCWTCSPWGFRTEANGEWVVRRYTDPRESKAVTIPPPRVVWQASPCSVSFTERLSLPDWEGISRWSQEASDLSCQVNSEARWQAYQEAVERTVGDQELASCVGGYPRWIQGEDTPDGANFLAQIDSESGAGIMWGDVGCVYLFRSTAPESQVSLVLQCC